MEIKYKGEIIPNVESYTYLGVEFNNKLDSEKMAKFRVNKGRDKISVLTPTLRNNLVPLEYKKMLVNSIITPSIIYGSEVFGMSEKRISSLRNLVNHSIGQILWSKNYCRNRVYEELDIRAVEIKAAMSRVRGYRKWSKSRGLIKELIGTSELFKSRKSTWSKTTRVWMKRFKINVPENESGKKEVMKNYIERIQAKDKAVITAMAKENKYGSGKLARRLELNGVIEPGSLNNFLKLRCGTYHFTNNLVFSKKINQENMNKCIFCKKNIKEDIRHLLLFCNAWIKERETYLGFSALNENVAPEILRKNIIDILGGDRPASGRKPADRIIATCKFLSAIARKRSVIIAEHSRAHVQ